MKTIVMCAAFASGLLVAAVGANAATIALTQNTADPISVGGSVSFTLSTEAGFPENIGFSSSLEYDADVLALTAITIDPVFDLATVAPLPVAPSGLTTVSPILGGLFFGTVSGAQSLAVFEFTALAAGTTGLKVVPVGASFSLTPGQEQINVAAAMASLMIESGVVPPAPAPIPLPAPAFMLLSAIAALGAARATRRTREAV